MAPCSPYLMRQAPWPRLTYGLSTIQIVSLVDIQQSPQARPRSCRDLGMLIVGKYAMWLSQSLGITL